MLALSGRPVKKDRLHLTERQTLAASGSAKAESSEDLARRATAICGQIALEVARRCCPEICVQGLIAAFDQEGISSR
jgi:hypothetical protein